MAETPGCPRPGPRLRRAVLQVVAAAAAVLFLWRLGSTGLVDETPPLFAAAARAMAETGDWLTPRVNGLPRYDKPPLVYWLMALGYLLPGQGQWDPLGTWAARLPSALSCAALMLLLAHTLLRWPQPPARTAAQAALLAFTAPLAFALSPLVLLWGRLAVSDALFTALVAASLLLLWRHAAATGTGSDGRGWWHGWLALGLAVLTKGPAALALVGLPLVLYGWSLGGPAALRQLAAALRPGRGLLLAAAVALPWYVAELAVEGAPFWQSFFGYHNLQRFTQVVNRHLQPWWYYGPVLVAASLPATPLLLRGLWGEGRALVSRPPRRPLAPASSVEWSESLGRLAACWLLAVLVLFTLSATKLPSYWLPATPAAGLLIASGGLAPGGAGRRWAWGLTLVLTAVLALAFAAAPQWLPLIQEPELPGLAPRVLASGRIGWAAGSFAVAALAALLALLWRWPWALAVLQLPLVVFALAALQPLWALGDDLRGAPVRQMAAAARAARRPGEPLAMVGILKPSLHFYSGQVVLYEGAEPVGLVNVADRLGREWRPGLTPAPATVQPTLLVVIDGATAAQAHWRPVAHQELARAGLYRLWRLERRALERRAAVLQAGGEVRADWQQPRPERY